MFSDELSIFNLTRRLRIGGHVQGVGFRPFVARAAQKFGINGSVCNIGGEVEVVAQGEATHLDQFYHHLLSAAPTPAKPLLLHSEAIDAPAYTQFLILASRCEDNASIHLLPDQGLCVECQHELNDPNDRRYHYPFINCTQCGPRYTIIERLPYDRANTTMHSFPLCAACGAEYLDINNRRYHAEPVACPQCGPVLSWRSDDGSVTDNEAAMQLALRALHHGAVVAVKGIGGYHLMCDARNESAVVRLRQRKQRPSKPLAVMYPLHDGAITGSLHQDVMLEPLEQSRLLSPERPVVLCSRRKDSMLAPSIAPGLGEIGVLLPYSPLHHLLLEQFAGPLVATSGNVSGEPVISANNEAELRLGVVADGFLHHNRPILHPADDSLYRPIAGVTRPLRLGRGSAPVELSLPGSLNHPVIAVGGHLKNTLALAWENRAVLSPHIGDLDSPRGMRLFSETLEHLQQLYGITAEGVICDAHPDYASSRWAHRSGKPFIPVLHHHAHASALYGEHHGTGDWLIFTWDGSGLGSDGTLWGGETFLGSPSRWQHLASLIPFRLPGGEKAARQPWRAALALCWESGHDYQPSGVDTSLLRHAWQHGVNTPSTSAVGRLFDGVAALLGLCHDAHFEGEAAMRLEALAAPASSHGALPLLMEHGLPWLVDWRPLLPLLLDAETTAAHRAGMFHQCLADTIAAVALQARERHGTATVGLCGGVFQNRLLTELASEQLQHLGFEVMLSTRVPCNDGGIAFGQIIEHLYQQELPAP